jgi:alpha-beta hydrolase superfamily lysophospholipase
MRAPATAFVVVAMLLGLLAPPLESYSQRVTFRAEDGTAISATWYEPSDRPAPAVILVHMLGRSRRDWDEVAERLASAGIGALAIDLRGHGESGHPVAGDTPDYSVMLQDLAAARRFLTSRGDVIPSRIGLLGASIGANLVVLQGAADPVIASLALLSPSLDYRGLRIEAAARKYGNRPMLLVSSDDDGYARRSVADLQKTGSPREVMQLSAAGHGTNMLRRAPELEYSLVDWFRRTLK